MPSQEKNVTANNNPTAKYKPSSDDTSTIVTIGVFIVIVTLVGAAAITLIVGINKLNTIKLKQRVTVILIIVKTRFLYEEKPILGSIL